MTVRRKGDRRHRILIGDGQCHERVAVGPSARRERWLAGFTLVELLVAMAVLSVIMSAMYGSYRATTGSIVNFESRAGFEQRARLFVQSFSRQLRCCYGGQRETIDRSSRDESDVAGDRNPNSDALFRAGEPMRDGLLGFATSRSTRNRESYSEQLQFISYRFDAARRVLCVYERPFGQLREDEKPNWRPVLTGVVGIELECFDGKEWYDEWDSATSLALPKAVRVQLVMESQNGQTFFLRWITPISCRMPEGTKGRRMKRSPMRPSVLEDD